LGIAVVLAATLLVVGWLAVTGRVPLSAAGMAMAGVAIVGERLTTAGYAAGTLDPRAEHDLFERIRALLAGRTVPLISHRFSSVRHADRIYVLDAGCVTEAGTHEELMANQGLYAELFRLQAAAYLTGTHDGF
jgi:ABC-type glutathione transport system ATPase component